MSLQAKFEMALALRRGIGGWSVLPQLILEAGVTQPLLPGKSQNRLALLAKVLTCAGEQADIVIRARALGVVDRPEAGKAAKRLPLSLTCSPAPMLELLGAPVPKL